MDNLIVGVIVGAAFWYCGRHLVRLYKGESGCSCSAKCGGCTPAEKHGCQNSPFVKL